MVFIEDTVGYSSSVDAAIDLDECIAVWFGEIRRKTAIYGSVHWRKAAGTLYRWNSSLSRNPPWMAAARTAVIVSRKRW